MIFLLCAACAGHSHGTDAPPAPPSSSTKVATPTSNTSANGKQNAINASWNPPMLVMADLRTIGIDDFCRILPDAAKYNPFFIAAGKKHHINPTLLAAIAMEESHCDPGVSRRHLQQ